MFARVVAGGLREIWQEAVAADFDAGASDVLDTDIACTAADLCSVEVELTLTAKNGTPTIPDPTVSIVNGHIRLTIVNNAGALGNNATWICKILLNHTIQSRTRVAGSPLVRITVVNGVNSGPIAVSEAETIRVAIAGGDFTDPATAVGAANALATAATPYIVRIAPGDYTTAPFTIAPYVKVLGSGWVQTILRTNVVNVHFITLSPASGLREVNLYGPTALGQACVYHAPVADPRPASVVEVSISQGYYGVLTEPTVLASPLLIQTLAYAHAGFGITSLLRGEQLASVQITQGFASGPAGTIAVAYSFWGPGVNCLLSSCQHECSTGDGVYVDNGAIVRLLGCCLANGINGIHVGSTGASKMRATGTMIQQLTGGYTRAIWYESPTATGSFSGSADRTKIINTVGAVFTASFSDVYATDPGSTTLGELHAGTSPTTVTPYVAYGNATFLSGLVSGGAVTRAGGRVVNVALGAGFLNDGSVTVPVTWGNGTATVTAGATEYIYVDSTGTVQRSAIQPSYSTNIVLAQAVADAGSIVLLTRDEVTINHQTSRIQEYFEDVIGPINITGAAASVNGGVATRIDISGGEFVVGLSERDVLPLVAPTFVYWYRTGAVWTSVAGSTDVNSTDYNDPATGLAALAGAWKKDLVFLVVSSAGVEVHVVYGQETFLNQGAAEAGNVPVGPDILEHYGQRTTGLVIHGGVAAIASVVDYRPRIGQAAGVTVTTGDHDLLLHLANDTHVQYFGSGAGGPAARSAAWLALQPGNAVNLVTGGDTHDHTGGAGAVLDHDDLSNNGGAASHVALTAHLIDTANPHNVTNTQVGAPPNARTITAGAGLTGGGDLSANRTLDVVAGDGSIVVHADDIVVGVISDTQHGTRGGGTQHPAATANPGGVAGFLSAADKTRLDGMATGAAAAGVALPLAVGAANAGVAAAVSHEDHVHAHGAQALGAGTDHAAATTAVNGFMAATDKLKLDRIRSVRLAALQSNASTTWADVAGLSFSVAANTTYRFMFNIIWQSTATNTGIGFGVNGPAAATSVTMMANIPTTPTATSAFFTRAYSTGAGTGSTTSAIDTLNADTPATVQGVFVNGANAGTLSLAFRSESATSVSVRAGSVGIIQEIA